MSTLIREIERAIGEGVHFAVNWAALHIREIIIAAGAIVVLLITALMLELGALYSHYAAMIDIQLNNQALQRPAGIYAAPRRVGVGQQISIDELKDRLLRAGYQEGGEADQFASGSFSVGAGTVEVRTNEQVSADRLPQLLRISFQSKPKGKGEISALEDLSTSQRLSTIRLPAELMTADLNAKTQARSFVDFAQIPPVLVNALTSIEDRKFFSHAGLDWRGICRAFIRNRMEGRIREGGSTITQQLIKTQFLTTERTWKRKFAEAMMALAIERRLNKEQIFTLYANRVYLGQSGMTMVYGFKQAAQVFFGKDLSQLSLSEAALLAGLIQAPNRYSPYLHPEAATARRNVVLRAMVAAGKVSPDEARTAEAERLAVVPPARPSESAALHFIDYVGRELLAQQIDDEERQHLQVETSLDPDLQQAANEALQEQLKKLDKLLAGRAAGERPEAALIALDPHTGEVLALVGGRDYASSQLNRVTDAKRQPGSIFKPFIYAAALAQGISPTTKFSDAPQEFNFGYDAIYRPQNFRRSYSYQPVMLRDGIIRSLNVVAVDAAMQVGLANVAEMAARTGLPRPQLYPSMALGAFEATPFEVAQAYSTFANDGLRVTPFGIKAVKDGGVVIREMAAPKAAVLSATQAYMVTDMLQDVVNYGTAARIRRLGYRGPAAGKTGSSRDAWFAGYTPNLLVVVWVGFDDYRDLGLTGGEAAAPIWTDFINRALALRPDLKAAKFVQPSGMDLVEIDPENGMLANEFCPHRRRVLLPSYLIPASCFEHQAATENDSTFETEPQPDDDEDTDRSEPALHKDGEEPAHTY